MISLVLYGTAILLILGVIAKYGFDYFGNDTDYKIDWQEFVIASVVMLLVVIPFVAWAGVKACVSNQVTYNENWGGFEIHAVMDRKKCRRDGSMRHYYKGDPYIYEWDEDVSYTDSKGNTHHRTEHHSEVRYHNIPYTTEEWTFIIKTTLGDYEIAHRNLPTNPDHWRYRKNVPVPKRYWTEDESGIPAFWQAAKDRIESGDPGPVTARRTYANYILASKYTILKRYSDSIDKYEKAGLLPAINQTFVKNDWYLLDRVYFVGVQPLGDWYHASNRFDAALGHSLQGDLHLVIVDANKIPDLNNYAESLFAYWQSDQFGKNALSKNGIVVIISTEDGKRISAVRTCTGMPEGNESMIVEIESGLKGAELKPEVILGNPHGTISGDVIKVDHLPNPGLLENIIWGTNAFKRVHMGKPGEKGNIGYTYLLREVEPTGRQKVFILLVEFLLACVAWGICLAHGIPQYRRYRRSCY